MLRKRFLAALPAFLALPLVDGPDAPTVVSGAPEGDWDLVRIDGHGLTIKIREGHADQREVLLLPSTVHESLRPAKPQGLYICDQRDSPVWRELAELLQHGVGRGF